MTDTATLCATPVESSIGSTSPQMLDLMLRASGLARQAWPEALAAGGADRPRGGINLNDFMQVGAHLVRQAPAGTELGLRMGRLYADTDHGLPAQIARTAPDLRTAISCLLRYTPLTTRYFKGTPQLLCGPQPVIRLYPLLTYCEQHTFVIDAVLAIWVQLLRQISGQRQVVQGITLQYPHCEHPEAMQRHFRVNMSFASRHNQILLHPAALDWPVAHPEPQLHRQLRYLGDALLAEQTRNQTLSGQVQQWLMRHLEARVPSLDDCAAAIGMPGWTLRRKLALEDTSFQALLDSLRSELARAHLRETRFSTSEIGFMLGFSTAGSFQRAFKRWTGMPVGDYRRHLSRASCNASTPSPLLLPGG